MSALLSNLLPLDHTPEELASLDLHTEGRRVRCAPPAVVLSEETMAAADDMADWAWEDHQRHQIAKFEVAMRAGRLRALPSCFGALEAA